MSRRTIAIVLWSVAAFFAIGFGLTLLTYSAYAWMSERPTPAISVAISLLKFFAPFIGAGLTAYAGRLGKLLGTNVTES